MYFDFVESGEKLITADYDGRLRWWILSTGSYSLRDEITLSKYVDSISVSADGNWLAVESGGSESTIITLIGVKNNKFQKSIARFSGHKINSSQFLFSNDDHWLASAQSYSQNPLDWDSTILLWDLKFPQFPRQIVLSGHKSYIFTMLFSPESKWLISSSAYDVFSGKADNTVRLWDLRKDSSFYSIALREYTTAINQVKVSPDGKWLIVSSGNEVKIWLLQLDELVDLGCRIAGRNFSQAEWQQYFPNEAYRVTCTQWPAGE
jgi:WD40 repeat protein